MTKHRRVHDALGGLYSYPFEQFQDASNYRPGDIVAFDRGEYWHYAIVVDVVDDNIDIIEYQSMDVINGVLAVTNSCSAACKIGVGRAAVACKKIYLKHSDCKVWKVCFPPSDCLPEKEVVSNARSKLGETVYDLIKNNCEHFAFWCKTGHKYSSQIGNAKKLLGQQALRTAAKPITRALVKKAIQKGAEEVTESVVTGLAKKVIQKGAEEVTESVVTGLAKNVIQKGTGEVTESVVTGLAKNVIHKGAEEVTESVVTGLAKNVIQKGTGEVTESVVTGLAKTVIQKGTNEATETVVAGMTQKAILKGTEEATEKVVSSMVKEAAEEGVKTVAKPATTCVTKSMIAVDVAVGVACAAWDISTAQQKYNNGDITAAEYNSAVGTRVVVAVGDTSCSIAGTVVGTSLGGPIGGVVGGVVGSLCGTLIGSATASVVISGN